ncbi:MAG: hypothetical protein ACP5EQ_08225 [Candidatus Cloacimonadia bacterium]
MSEWSDSPCRCIFPDKEPVELSVGDEQERRESEVTTRNRM